MSLDLNQIVSGIKLVKACSIKADKDSDESKTINLEVTFDDVPLSGVFQKAISQTVIQWQNGPGRSKFDTWTDHQTVKVAFKAPASSQVDPEQSIAAKLAAMDTQEERDEYIKNVLLKGIE